jgi:hypothetical protein
MLLPSGQRQIALWGDSKFSEAERIALATDLVQIVAEIQRICH